MSIVYGLSARAGDSGASLCLVLRTGLSAKLASAARTGKRNACETLKISILLSHNPLCSAIYQVHCARPRPER